MTCVGGVTTFPLTEQKKATFTRQDGCIIRNQIKRLQGNEALACGRVALHAAIQPNQAKMARLQEGPIEMDLGDLLKPDGVFAGLRVKNKKQALQELAHRAGHVTGLDERMLFDVLLQRERVGSTGVGRGIAIPHARVAGINEIATVFAQLDEPIDFDAPDGEPVDLVFVLLAPEHAGADHLKALARISRVLRDPMTLKKLRSARNKAALHAVLTEPLASHAA